MTLLTCERLCLGYNGREIVHDLDFSVAAGDYLCIVGENGAGKSTLMRTILGLQPPLRGSVRFGEGLTSGSIGYLPQQTVVQRDFPASVGEIVLSGCQGRCGMRPFYRKEDKARARRMMERLGLTDLQRRCYRELSGGQQQRALLARALCSAETVLLLDEPVTGLDPVVAAELYRIIQDLNREDGVTILMVSHDVAAAAQYAGHILHIGPDPFFGTRQEYLESAPGKRFLAEGGAAS